MSFKWESREVVLIEKDGKKYEPVEELIIDSPAEYLSVITEEVSKRNGEMINMESENNQTRFTYKIIYKKFNRFAQSINECY